MGDVPTFLGKLKDHTVLIEPFSVALLSLWPTHAFSVFHCAGGVAGGWLRPFPNVGWLEYPLNYGLPVTILAGSEVMCFPMRRRLKARWQQLLLAALLIYLMIWFRGAWPRLRYDQLMNIGWKRLIPLGMAMVLVNATVGMLKGR